MVGPASTLLSVYVPSGAVLAETPPLATCALFSGAPEVLATLPIRVPVAPPFCEMWMIAATEGIPEELSKNSM